MKTINAEQLSSAVSEQTQIAQESQPATIMTRVANVSRTGITHAPHDSGSCTNKVIEFPAFTEEIVGKTESKSQQAPIAKSYASIVRPNREFVHEHKLEFIKPQDIEGQIGVQFSMEDIESGVNQWRNAVVVYTFGSRPPTHVMQRVLERRWGTYSSIAVSLLKPGIFLVKLDNADSHARIREKGPWSFDNKPMIVKPWSQDLSLEKIGLQAVPVWVKLPHLPLQFWSNTMLSKISSTLGKPLFTDRMTAYGERLMYARVCVEMDVESTFPEKVLLRGPNGWNHTQQVEYEWKPARCTHCKTFGHWETSCLLKPRVQQVWKAKTTSENEKENGKPAQNGNQNEQCHNKPTIRLHNSFQLLDQGEQEQGEALEEIDPNKNLGKSQTGSRATNASLKQKSSSLSARKGEGTISD
ncbi:hypothetical protein RJ640_003043 [Escallonia rubra]|uniref:DUF4283 domain-containing protein n=1 Tax=Escallonia rubra TaxID=112253 RepID=A0AA88RTX2_9ASTE|nr:hypothetical protein RJ640_003043 [Escallonia rubra]